MKSAGVWSRRSRRRSSRWLLAAAGALVLFAGFSAPFSYADDDDAPVTAADAERMAPLNGSAGTATAPRASSSSPHAIVETAPATAAAPLTNPAPAREGSAPNTPPAPIDVSMPEMPSRPTIQVPSVTPLGTPG